MKNLSLRPATQEDIPVIMELCISSIREICRNDYKKEQIEAWVTAVKDRRRWQKALTEQYFVLAIEDGFISGFCSITRTGYLDFLFVHPGFTGKGLATQLLTEVENEAGRNGNSYIFSNVSKTARAFFEKMGFHVEKENSNKINEVLLINYRMGKNLSKQKPG